MPHGSALCGLGTALMRHGKLTPHASRHRPHRAQRSNADRARGIQWNHGSALMNRAMGCGEAGIAGKILWRIEARWLRLHRCAPRPIRAASASALEESVAHQGIEPAKSAEASLDDAEQPVPITVVEAMCVLRSESARNYGPPADVAQWQDIDAVMGSTHVKKREQLDTALSPVGFEGENQPQLSCLSRTGCEWSWWRGSGW